MAIESQQFAKAGSTGERPDAFDDGLALVEGPPKGVMVTLQSVSKLKILWIKYGISFG